MSMLGSSQFEADEDPLVNDINMTPFIDVMLVLLIVFMITLPVINHAVKVNLPKANASAVDKHVKAIDISIMADGSIAWDKQPLDDMAFKGRLEEAAKLPQAPHLRIYADKATEYGRVSFVMTSAQGVGLSKFDFVVDKTGS
ncbi:ExbD/TolR family protein [Biostraticola tofi]|uniref:Biopolymer transport protein ExbD n=1 Tax=Biostraticola tofi TaxID=466109 RepID=A0A4V2W3V6_9GAMM|nr:biopolymer transporter ExbD [Biostraticola tofi]TCV93519.1 biopolymer transport protein ExbD [Biostraticola tofi]